MPVDNVFRRVAKGKLIVKECKIKEKFLRIA